MAKWLVGIVVLAGMLVASQRRAEACGGWSMKDEERNAVASYLINSLRIFNSKHQVIGAVYLDDENPTGLRTVKDRKVIFDIKNGKLTKRGKAIATIDGATIAFGKRVYTIELTNPHKEHGDFSAWDLTVKRRDKPDKSDKTILTSTEASALCAPMHRDPPATDEQMQDEVRRRVIYYLAWRETGP